MRDDVDRAREALHAIPPDLPRDEWVRAGMAAQAAGLTFEDFDAWSAQAGNYDARAARDTWRSLKDGKGIGTGTLFHMARAAGWRPPKGDAQQAPSRHHRAQKGPAKGAGRPQEAARLRRPGMGAAVVWSRCEPATAAHGYIQAKQGTPDGLRVVPAGDPLRVSGLPMAGALVVPVLPLVGGDPVSLQFIAPPELAAQWKAARKSSKLNLPGAPMEGAFIVGDGNREPGDTVCVVEGIGQAWACWRAVGFPAVVCFGAGRMGEVARALRARDVSARLVLVPDRGKEAQAADIARAVGGVVATMPEDAPANFDANDYAAAHGHDALEDLLMRASEPPQPAPRFKLLTPGELHALPPLAWRVRGVLPAQGLAALYGPSASGKSFLGFDLAAAVAGGWRWFGCRVESAPVVYVALEGEAGFRLRAQAWEEAHAQPLPDGLRLVLQPFKLTEPADVEDLAAVVPAGAVVFVDTLNRAAPLADENSSRDMGEILEAAKRLQAITGGLVVLVHHTGKDAARGLRGHSSLFAAMDAAVEVSREGDRREWKVAKSKDGTDGDAHPFRLEVVELGTDDHGDAITSCVVRADDTPQDATRSRLPKGGNQRVVLDALGELLRKSKSIGKAGAPAHRPCVETEAAVSAIAPRLACEPKRQTERVRQALTGLIGSGAVTCRDGWLWLP